ncbi:MAG: histidine kinase [Bacteroidota bacterium]
MDKNRVLVRHIQNSTRGNGPLKIENVVRLSIGPDGYVWACGKNGISRIDPVTFATDNFENTPLQKFDSLFVSPLLFTDKDNLWIAASVDGLYHYNLATKKLEEHKGFKEYKSEGIYDIQADSAKNIYVGNRKGVKIFFTNGRIKTISQKEGLLIDGGEGLLLDRYNRMWIGNDIGLVCYNPTDSSLQAFDERFGLSIYGFRIGSYFQTPNGEFAFGTPKGIQYFYPDSLFNKKITINALVNRIEAKSIVSNITENSSFHLSPSSNQVTFYFSSVDFSPHLRTYYEYQLTGIDPDWIRVADQNSVRYNSLPPGEYIFKLRVSNDNKNWQKAENEVTIIIATPFYKSWWFKFAGALLGIGLIWVVLNYYRNKQKREKEQLETEVVINYFASQINSHHKTDALLWDVARNCISRLGFEDCVIYLVDEQRNVLVQKAAYGPKNRVDFTIHKPIEIPVGEGITGKVAQTGVAEIIHNTEEDARYIVDDESRHAEITVPILINKKVVGIIDSEHSRKNFFTQKHMGILQTIAVLCANQIQKTKAEEEKQKATIELLENKQKAVESRLQSLRLQMNPHFLFNALNSVQQMILANEEMVATKYLSRFSKLLRAILVHSDKETISLKEELEILTLYVELESIRFKESFRYSIVCEQAIDTDEIKIPTLLVQPFVENAIWHGLMHKEGERILKVGFTEENDFIKCVIEDNGIGRKRSAATKIAGGQDKKHTSKGIEVSKERLKTIQCKGVEGSITILDLVDANGEGAGTRVEINFPIKNC